MSRTRKSYRRKPKVNDDYWRHGQGRQHVSYSGVSRVLRYCELAGMSATDLDKELCKVFAADAVQYLCHPQLPQSFREIDLLGLLP